MNSAAHAVLGVALLARGPDRRHVAPVLTGSLLPDLPLFLFYGWQKLVLGAPESHVWGAAYFESSWQAFFDLFNSIPLAALGFGASLWTRSRGAALFCAALLLHALGDLPLHREDAHGHLYPLSDWRFVSPFSYWDPRHHGARVGLAELLAMAAASWVLWRRFQHRLGRVGLVAVNALSLAAWIAFHGLQIGWGSEAGSAGRSGWNAEPLGPPAAAPWDPPANRARRTAVESGKLRLEETSSAERQGGFPWRPT